MDTALPQKFPFILDRNLAKANCTGNRLFTSCSTVVLGLQLRLNSCKFPVSRTVFRLALSGDLASSTSRCLLYLIVFCIGILFGILFVLVYYLVYYLYWYIICICILFILSNSGTIPPLPVRVRTSSFSIDILSFASIVIQMVISCPNVNIYLSEYFSCPNIFPVRIFFFTLETFPNVPKR